MLSRILPALLLLGAAALLVFTLLGQKDDGPGDFQGGDGEGFGGFVFPVTFAPVESGRVVETIELVGDVVTARRAMLSFERGGRIEDVTADLGDTVEERRVLARLDDSVLRERIAVAIARKAASEADKGLADREADRGREMGSRVLPEADQDKRASEAVAAAARVAELEAEIKRLNAELAQGELRAPFPGVVTQRYVTLGSYASQGEVAFEVVDLANREVHLEVPAGVAAGITEGATLVLRSDEIPGLEWQGKLDSLIPAADPATRTFRGVVRLRQIDSERRLLPGMFVRAELQRREAVSSTIVPADSILHSAMGTIVVQIVEPPADAEPGPMGPVPTAVFVPVRVLASNGEKAAVESLDPTASLAGGRVVVTGVDNVFPGAPLMAQPHDREAGNGGPGDWSAAEGSDSEEAWVAEEGAAGEPGTPGEAGAGG